MDGRRIPVADYDGQGDAIVQEIDLFGVCHVFSRRSALLHVLVVSIAAPPNGLPCISAILKVQTMLHLSALRTKSSLYDH